MRTGYDIQKLTNDIKVRVDGISTFPVETERPIVEELILSNEVLWINLYGDVDDITLKRLADQIRDEITALPEISQAETFTRDFEISIEVSESKLREYGLSFDDVARAVRRSSVDLPAGSIKTVRRRNQPADQGTGLHRSEYESLVLRTRPDGTRILLGDVAKVVDGFVDTNAEYPLQPEKIRRHPRAPGRASRVPSTWPRPPRPTWRKRTGPCPRALHSRSGPTDPNSSRTA